MSLPVTIYTPESPLRNPTRLVGEMFRDLKASRELAWRLFVRNIRAQYRQSLLGYIWAFLPPIATSLAFMYLNSQSIVNVGDTGMPYPAFVLIGTTLWQTFVDSINAPIKMVQTSRAMLTKINFPREALLLAGCGEVVFNFLIRSLIVLVAMIWFHIVPTAAIALAPVGFLALMAFGTMVGLLLTPAGILYQDIGRGLTIVTSFWMLLTPVVYPASRNGAAAFLAKWNPVSPLVTTTRDWLTGGQMAHIPAFILVTVVSIVLLLCGWVLYRLALPHLISRIGN